MNNGLYDAAVAEGESMMTGEILLLTSLKRGDSRARLGAPDDQVKNAGEAHRLVQMITALTRKGYSMQALADELWWPALPSWAGARVQSQLIQAAIVWTHAAGLERNVGQQ